MRHFPWQRMVPATKATRLPFRAMWQLSKLVYLAAGGRHFTDLWLRQRPRRGSHSPTMRLPKSNWPDSILLFRKPTELRGMRKARLNGSRLLFRR